jgi:hypothetical protein
MACMSSHPNVITVVMDRISKLERKLAALVEERQTLRATGADAPELERNRREIVAGQQELSEALISVYAHQSAFAAA